MEYKLQDLLDIPLFQRLQDKLNEIYSFPSAIIDNEGNVLTATAWQDICTMFHRVNPESLSECRKSDQYIARHIHEANPAVTYICPHRLMDSAIPIIIDGNHLGTFFTGQFFLEKPDINFFIKQAKKYGFDEKEYLEAVSKVPVWSKEQLNLYLSVIKTLAEILAEIGYKNLREIEKRKIIEEQLTDLKQLEANLRRSAASSKQVEEALKESEEKYKTAFKTIPGAVVITQMNGTVVDVNPAFSKLSGFSKEEAIGSTLFDLNIYALPEERNKLINALQAKGMEENFETLMYRKDGSLRTAQISASLITLNNEPHILSITRDITERKQVEEALIQEQYLMSALMDNLPDHIYFKDLESRFFRNNKAHIRSFGLSDPTLLRGKSDFDFFVKEVAQRQYEDEQEIIRTGESINKEEFTTRNDGSINWYYSTKIPLRNKEGNIIGTFGISRDITDRKELENELIKAKEKAEESSRLKNSLLLNMSHELRTPLNGILGFAGLLAETLTDSEQKHMADIITQSGKRLMATLNSIIELSQVEADHTSMEFEIINVGEITADVLRKNEGLFEKKRIQLIESIERDVYSRLDKNLFTNIVFHLVDNAIKYTKIGSVSVIVCKEVKNNEPFAVIKVIDTGIGISGQQLSYIFDAFRQVDEGIGRSYEGTGLGLTLCKKFTTLIGGEIEVESKIGVGSTFTVRFPLSKETPIPKQKPPLEGQVLDQYLLKKKPRILIVEDNETNSDLIAIFLKNLFITDQVYNGVLAVEMANLNNYDIILMDINLGRELGGIEAAIEIRKINRYMRIPIIVVTGYSTEKDKQYFLSQGFDDFLSKPFDQNSLISIITKALKKKCNSF